MKSSSFFVVALFSIISIIPVYAQLADSPWPMYQQNARHTGQSPYSGPNNPKILWEYKPAYNFSTDPAVVPNGTIYIGSEKGILYAFNKDGKEIWHFQAGGKINFAPALDSNGIIYFGSEDLYLYAVNPDGTERWRLFAGCPDFFSPFIGDNGSVYICALFKETGWCLLSVNMDGIKNWQFNTAKMINYSPVIGLNGVIFFNSVINDNGTEVNCLFAVNPDGSEKWSFQVGDKIDSSPVIAPPDGTIFIIPNNNILYAVNPDGTKRWQYDIGNISDHTPSVGKDGTIFLHKGLSVIALGLGGGLKWKADINNTGGSNELTKPVISEEGTIFFTLAGIFDFMSSTPSFIYAYNSNGSQKWKTEVDPSDISKVFLGKDGTIYAGEFGAYRNLYAINPDGSQKWLFKLSSDFISLTIGNDGTLYNRSEEHFYAVNPDGTKKWILNLGSGNFESTLAIGVDGTIYAGSNDRYLHAIYPDGTKKWAFQTEGQITTSPAINSDGIIYFGSHDDNLYAINPDGTKKWSFETGDMIYLSSPAIGLDGVIYFGSLDHYFYALNPTGTLKWKIDLNGTVPSSPAIDPDGIIYVGSVDSNLYAINPSGTILWQYKTGDSISNSPAVDSAGTIYITSDDNNLYALNRDGTLKWIFKLLEGDNTSPSIGDNGNIYVSSGSDTWNNYLFSINPSGNENWRKRIGSYANVPPTIGKDGNIYVIANGDLFAISSKGTENWRFNIGLPFNYSSPVISSNGLIYVGSTDNNLFAIGDEWSPTRTPTRTATPTPSYTSTPVPTSGDIIPPIVTIVSPQNDEQVTGIFPVTVDANDASGIASVDVNIDGAEWRQCVKTEDVWIFNWNTTSYENQKTISLQARAKDKSVNSNIGYSSMINVSIYNEKPITFNLSIMDKTSFSSGDNLKLTIDISSNDLPQTIDLYFVMIHPSTQLYSYIQGGWVSGLYPILIKFEMLTNMDIKDAVLLNMKLPSNSPPINSSGNYIFAIAAVEYNTDYFVSNIATASFEYK